MDKYEVLKEYFNYDSFRFKQEEIIDLLLENQDLIAVMATGAGKSLCFQIPALMKEGLTLVISPLISLMFDQVKELKKLKIKAEFLNSSLNSFEVKEVYQKLSTLKLLYISPERLSNQGFKEAIKKITISEIIIDEAHCISMWGQDFRPSYKEIKPFIDNLAFKPVIGAFTATANTKVIKDIELILGLKEVKIIRSSSDRKNLFYGVLKPKNKYDLLVKYLLKYQGLKTIVYCLTRRTVLSLSKQLFNLGIKNIIYHGGLEDEEKKASQKAFINDYCNVIIATNAFGMGINKKDIRLIIVYELPLRLEDLVQQMGRCSRDGKEGMAYLFYDEKDIKTCEYFLDNSDITKELRRERYKELDKVIAYANTKTCLHGFIIKSFEGIVAPNCKNCSNCLKKLKPPH